MNRALRYHVEDDAVCVNSSIAVGPPTPSPSSPSVLWVSTDIHWRAAMSMATWSERQLVRLRLCRGRVAAVVPCRSEVYAQWCMYSNAVPRAQRRCQHKESRSEDSHLQLVLLLCAGPSWIFHSPGLSKASALHIHHQWLVVWCLDNTCRFDVPLNQQQQCRSADAHGNLQRVAPSFFPKVERRVGHTWMCASPTA